MQPPGVVYTLTAIDFVIQRGSFRDWIDLRAAALANLEALEDVRAVCETHLASDRDEPWLAGHGAWLAYLPVIHEDETCERLWIAFIGVISFV